MYRKLSQLGLIAAPLFLLAGGAWAQTTSLEGDVKGDDGQPVKGALVKIERKDIRGNYKVKTDKKGHYFHAGLPIGTYKITVEIEGKDRDVVDNVRSRLGDPLPINFDLQALKQKQEALQRAAESGTLTNEQTREMSAEQRAAVDKSMKERLAVLAKNKALSDSFNQGMTAFNAKQCEVAAQAFTKAAEVDPKQVVVWQQLAEAYTCLAGQKTGAEHDAALGKALDAYQKALELKPDDAASHNNYGLALVRAKKFKEALDELGKAAQLDPPGAGKYYYNLGAVLTNNGQLDAAGEAFKKAIEADPKYAPAQYQYGLYLVGKAQMGADNRLLPPPGTKEAFQKYLELEPNGPYAQPCKDMIATLDSSIQTQYQNPDAAKKGKKK
jgi:tetratricopeptide (TPR) repeat protein